MKPTQKFRRLCSTFAAASMTLGLFSAPVIAQKAETDSTPATVSVYPRPQSVEYDGTEGMKLDGTVDVVVHGSEDAVTINRLKAILDEQNIAYEIKNAAAADHAVIHLSMDPDHCATCTSTLDGASHEQGYVLVSDNDENAKGEVVITGHDQDGLYNGILTLGQMLDQRTEDGRMAETVISDYPDILLRGAIEGFYGLPWSFENRKEIIRDTAKFKMNTYIYAPKDDPYHKDKWKELYPETEAAHIQELVEAAIENNMTFIWCAHPGNGFNYSNDTDYNALIAKIDQLYSLGVRQFGISYDDLSGDNDGVNQATVINRVNAYLKTKGDCDRLLTVGKRYTDGWGSGWQTYLKPFLDTLDEDVTLMWTGLNTGGICGKNSFNGPKNQVGYDKPLAFWFNYPVNDMAFGRLLMGEIDSTLMDPEVTGLAGFYMNPMNQAAASKVSLNQGADYSWNTAEYNSSESWQRAIEEVGGVHADALARFADNTSSHTFEDIHVGESRQLKPKLDALEAAIASGNGLQEAVLDLKAAFVQMKEDAAELRTVEDELLLADIEQHVNAYEQLGLAGEAAMNGFLAALNFNSSEMADCQQQAASHLVQAGTYRINILDKSNNNTTIKVEVGEKYIKPFLSTAASQMNAAFKAALASRPQPRLISSDKAITGTIGTDEGTPSATFSATLPYGGYAGFAMSSLNKIASFECDLPEGTRLEYSCNGADWNTYTDETGNVDVAYVRIVNESKTPLVLEDFTISATSVFQPIESMTASTNVCNGSVWDNNRISNAVDGNYSTRFWSNGAASDGDHIQVDLGTVVPLSTASICFGGNPKGASNGIDGFSKTGLEISEDGAVWTPVGTDLEVAQYDSVTKDGTQMAKASFSAGGQKARYVRFVCRTAHAENWIQVYEIEVEQGGSSAEDSAISLGTTNTSGDIGSLCDANLNTAFTVTEPAEGDYVIYNLSTVTSVDDLLILQSSVSNGKVSYQKYDGSWTEGPVLSELNTTIDVNDRIKAVRIDFEAGTNAAIQEIIVRATATEIPGTIVLPIMDGEVLDYTLLSTACAKGAKLAEADFQTGWDAFKTALDAGQAKIYNAQTQDEIYAAASALSQAMLDLRLIPSAEKLASLN